MIYCEEPRRVQYQRTDCGLYATSDGRVIENPPNGIEASYAVEKGRFKVKTPMGKIDLAKLIVHSFTKHRPDAEDIGFKDGDPSNCRLGNLIIYEEGEQRRKPDPIVVVADGRKTTYFSVKEASYCENLSINQIAYILNSPNTSVMGRRCRAYGIESITRIAK